MSLHVTSTFQTCFEISVLKKKGMLVLEEKRNCMSDCIKKVIISIIMPFPRDRKHGQKMAALIAWEGK